MSELLRRRVQERLDTLGINPFEAERRAGFKRGYVNDLLIGKKHTFREKAIAALATALECDPGFLLGSQSVAVRSDASPYSMALSGIAEAGAWRDPNSASLPETRLPIMPDPRFDPEQIALFLVRGDHAAGLGIVDGSVVFVLKDQANYRDGDVVLAKREASDGRTEFTIRLLSGGALSARPGKGAIPTIQLGEAVVFGLIVTAIRVFGLPA